MVWRQIATMMPALALALPACAPKAKTLPDDPVDRAATCAIVAAATERGQAGVKGELSPDAQARIFHYPLLAGASGTGFDDVKAQAVFQREPKLFDDTIKGKWQTLRPACAAAFPATRIGQPTLPEQPFDRAMQCYMLVDFLRKAFGGLGGTYAETATTYGVLTGKLDTKVSAGFKAAGITTDAARKAKRDEALAAAARLGPPPAVQAACNKAYG